MDCSYEDNRAHRPEGRSRQDDNRRKPLGCSRIAAAQLIKSAGVPALVLFNAAPHSATTLLDDARAIVEDAGLTPAPVVLRERSAYRVARPAGKAVVETEPRGKAAREMSELKDWVLAQLQVCTPSKLHDRKTASNG